MREAPLTSHSDFNASCRLPCVNAKSACTEDAPGMVHDPRKSHNCITCIPHASPNLNMCRRYPGGNGRKFRVTKTKA